MKNLSLLTLSRLIDHFANSWLIWTIPDFFFFSNSNLEKKFLMIGKVTSIIKTLISFL